MKRFHQAVLILSTVFASWFGMQAVHELGHVLGAWLTGGIVERVVLHPLTISRTDLGTNPQPLLVVWAGPVFGVLLPQAAWGVWIVSRIPNSFLARFFAGFCLLVNGTYIGLGSFQEVGDCGEMLRHGSPIWLLWLFGLVAAPAGLGLWHGQGSHFGLGLKHGCVSISAAYTSLAVGLALIALGLVFSS